MGHLLKRLLMCLGDGNTGKSTLTKAPMSAFGEYVGTFNAECFSNKDTSQDEALAMSWALLLRYKRTIFSNKSPFIKSLISEVKAIRDSLRKIIEYQQLFEEAKTVKPLNLMGSFINRILCYYENEVLQVMINFLNKKQYEIA